MGVWIEILLKLSACSTASVAPFVGVWIEINLLDGVFLNLIVAPFVGVWIEISNSVTSLNPFFSRSLCGSVD